MHNVKRKGNRWNEDALNELSIERNFRLRGLEMTRLETFIDAAFAFVLTILVISFDEIPANYQEMVEAIKRIPSFLASFSILMMFWLSHRRWSRRYGLETTRSVLLSLAIIFMILVYVYPMRMIFEGMFHNLSGGYFTTVFKIASYAELRGMFIFYSSGFTLMALLFCDLYRTALLKQTELLLNDHEIYATRMSIVEWFTMAIFGVVSILLSIVLPDQFLPLAGYVYAGLYVGIVLATKQIEKPESVE